MLATVIGAPYRALARANALANHRLLSACERLRDGEFTAPRTGFFPSLKATLNHILVVDWFYVDALEGGRLGPAAYADEEPCATASELRREQAKVDRRLVAFCEALGPDDLSRHVQLLRARGPVDVDNVAAILLQLFQHQIHHRGQAHAMLSGTTVPPPQLDEFVLAEDISRRSEEMAALGWEEGGQPPR